MANANRIEIEVTMTNIYSYTRPAYGYGIEDAYIYTMTDDAGKTYVWKTTAYMCVAVYEGVNPKTANFFDGKGRAYDEQAINKGDKIRIRASVKGESEYKGKPQTEITRVKVMERTFRAETPAERKARIEAENARKAQEQRDSLKDGDFVWTMTYKQYKEHYSDCETIVGSYDAHDRENEYSMRRIPATIAVIIRDGRLKKSGVRGERYSGYRLQNAAGEQVTLRAVKEENAIRRAEKEYGGSWKCVKIFQYDSHRWF